MNKAEYLRAINEARDNEVLWKPPVNNVSVIIGELEISMTCNPNINFWVMKNTSGDTLSHGSSQTRQLAWEEALAYARHYASTMVETEHAC